MKFLFYPHVGSLNHGCEAIVRATCYILDEKNDSDKILFSMRVFSDEKVGLDKIVKIMPLEEKVKRFSIDYIVAKTRYCLLNDKDSFEKIVYKNILRSTKKETIAFSIGGDTYCYSRPNHIYFINKYLRKKKIKTILWGCSIEEKLIDEDMKADLKKYDYIFARESISYNLIKKINSNTYLYPDPAFVLNSTKCNLPKEWKKNKMIGINISPLIIQSNSNSNLILNNYNQLIKWIIKNTDYNIALIPHVCIETNDDRIAIKKLLDLNNNKDRLIEISEHNCCKQKYIISKCEFIICSRTHVSIAAYSSCVPTLVLGYSVKSIGIARDIFGNENDYVLSIQNVSKENEILNAFIPLWNKRNNIRSYLFHIMPNYIEKIYDLKNKITKY